MKEKLCAVPDCPALALPKQETCGPHGHARLASALHISQSAFGKGGKRCVSCRRLFKASDYAKPVAGNAGYTHIACEPPASRLSRRKIREAEKPLFSIL